VTYDKKTREHLLDRRNENWFYKTLVEKISVEFLLDFFAAQAKTGLYHKFNRSGQVEVDKGY